MAPVIGVTYGYDVGDDCTNNYIRAVRDHGGIPYPVYPGVPDFNFAELDGLLLTGGGDIHPDNFGEEWHPTLKSVDEDRDGLEIPLCQQALEADLPVFGICRGIQIMSIAMGGNLYQDIPSEYSREALPHKIEVGDARHNIQIEPDSLLSELVGKTADEVNSSHHQAVGEIGGEFVITGGRQMVLSRLWKIGQSGLCWVCSIILNGCSKRLNFGNIGVSCLRRLLRQHLAKNWRLRRSGG